MSEPPVEQIVQSIVRSLNPRRILLFGSRAQGVAKPDSDVDLLVEMETDLNPFDRRLAVERLFGLRDWAMDVVGTLVYTVVREGKVLYERA